MFFLLLPFLEHENNKEDPPLVDASKEQECHVPSSDDVVKKEDIPMNEASVDASIAQQGQLLIYVLYSAFKKLSKCAN